jgi:phage-related protein
MSADRPRKIPVVFYRTRAGGEIVRNWLRELDEMDRNAIGQDLMRVQYRWLGDGLWEVRSDLPSNRIARMLFCIYEGKVLVLHGFIKKAQKTPGEDMALARKRRREFEA